jgi:DNA polymerase-3 subunit gamma/tau
MQILPGTQGVDTTVGQEMESFSQEELELQWMSMCNRMPQRLSGIATRMKNMNPVITEMPAVEVVVANEIIKTEVEQIKGSIVNTLKLYLHNSDITLTVKVAEKSEREKILTRREQFMEMVKQNPSVGKLKEMFDLELA